MDISNLAVNGKWLVISLLLVALLIVGIIIFMKSYLKKEGDSLPGHAPKSRGAKYPQVDVFKMSGTFFNLALLSAVLLTILAFNWTTYEKEVYIPEGAMEFEEEIEVEPPRTKEPPPPPPPPPPPVIEEVPDEEVIEDEPIFEDMTADEDEEVVAKKESELPPPPPPPPPPPEKEEEIFKIVEEMPHFPGCEKVRKKEKRDKCAQDKMLEFIYKNIKYPAIAKENGVEGMVVISFVVEKDGSITDARVVRDIGGNCGKEALRVVKMMPKWVPGKQRGRPVRVQFNLPVKFKLQN